MFTTTLKDGEVRINFRHTDFVSANGAQKITECTIEYNGIKFTGVAFCHPNDRFSKVIGRKLSLSRALRFFSFTKEERRDIWNEYFKHHKKGN